ncbi:MAG: class I SAM-dependent methyltransferase [Myxococcota bacterium]
MESTIPQLPAREGYDRWAPVYDTYDNPLVALEGPVVHRLVGIPRGLRVADVGCGTGRHALRLAAAGAEVTGVDFSRGMLDALRAKEPPPSLRLVEHDLDRGIPLPADAFDVVLCCLVVEHLDSPTPMLAEMARIGRPGARIVVTDLHPHWTHRGLHARFREAEGATKLQIEGQAHRISDYVMAGIRAGLRLEEIGEHVVDEQIAQRSVSARKYVGEPFLLTLCWRVPG